MLPPSSVVRTVLPNGLTVLLRHDTSAPVATVVTYVKAGYFDETDDVVGIAHVLEHMFFKGTPSRGVGEIARETKGAGGHLNAHTIYDHTSYYAVLPREGFARGLEVQADAYANSLIDAGELAKELEVIIQEAKRKLDSPPAVAIETLYALLHDRHRIRRWRIGREEGLRCLTRDQLVAFYRNFYRPSNTLLVIAGDVDPDATLHRVEALYGALPPGVPARTPGPAETAPAGFRYQELSGDIAQTQLVVGWRTRGALHADTPLLDLGAAILADGRASRLYRSLRERQLASAVTATNYTPGEIGVFTTRAEVPAGKGRDAAGALWREMGALAEHGPTPQEVRRAQRLFEAQWLRRLETTEGQANFLAEWEALGDWRLSAAYYDQTMAATPGAIGDAVARHLVAGEASVLVYRPRGEPAFAADADEARLALESGAPALGASPGTEPLAPPAVVATGMTAESRTGPVAVFRTRHGVPVLVRRRAGSPMAHVGVFSAAGAAMEPARVAGGATLMARTAVKGTARRHANDIALESELLGGTIAPAVTADGMGWSLSVPLPRLAEAVALLADVVQQPSFPEAALETERAIALAHLAQLRDDMYRYPFRLATAAAYGEHPYGRALLGSEETLASVSTEELRRLHLSHVLRGPALIAAVADLPEAELAERLAGAFAMLQGGAPGALATPPWPAGVVVNAERRDKAQTALAIAFPSPTRRDDARFGADLLAGITSGLGGRFFEALREQRSLAYTVQTVAMERVYAGSFVAYIATSPDLEDVAREGLLQQFAALREAPVTDDELQRAKTYALGTHAIAQESGATQLNDMVSAWLQGTGLEELEAFEGRVRAVSARELQELARACFDEGRRVEGVVRGSARPATPT